MITKRMKNNIKEAFLTAWIMLMFLEYFFLFLWLKFNGRQYVWFPVGLIVLWWVITITINHFNDKREKRRQEEYRAKYISQITLTDERFGSLVFDYDSLEDRLEAYPCDLPPFGHHKPDSLTVQMDGDDFTDLTLTLVTDALHEIYAREEEIINACCQSVKETYDDEDIRDEYGALITMEYIREHFGVTGFDISINRDWRGVTVEVHGGMSCYFHDHIDEHGVTVELCKDTRSAEWYFYNESEEWKVESEIKS